jgi:uncharacterized membrane protein
MDDVIFGLTLAGVLCCGIMAGLFFTFSVFLMRALRSRPPAEGMAAMQAINAAIYHPLFGLVFFGSVISSLGLIAVAVSRWDEPGTTALLVGSIVYLVGAILMTGRYHVPRNEQLDRMDPKTEAGVSYWKRYAPRWTLLNHVRTLASLTATGAFALALRSLNLE